MSASALPHSPVRGRPPGTSRRSLELIALRLFAEQGFDETTLEQIAGEAGISKRTFFRYFDSKDSLLWSAFDHQVTAIRAELRTASPEAPMMDAIRHAVVAALVHQPVPELRTRMTLIRTATSLSATATSFYESWEAVIADFVSCRTGRPAADLFPQAVARAALATCRAAYDAWVTDTDGDLPAYLDTALAALASGFDPAAQPERPE